MRPGPALTGTARPPSTDSPPHTGHWRNPRLAHSSAPADWPAAASPLMAEALQAPSRPARVLAAFPTALYLQLDRHELVLPVLAEDALRLPTGLRLALPAREIDWGVEPGSHVSVGGGRVRLPRRDVVAVRA